ncbi:MAG: CYTH domain-containing protein [Lachnoclostridium sp.]|jgi:adenylate cyclase|nr:CYTH domain-containing protein [Lachnoclostridium sp.]
MATEIERKFLLAGNALPPFEGGTLYEQGYLSENVERTVRIRIAGEKAYITIKGKTTGYARLEFEYEIPAGDARELMKLCEHAPISKTRYVVYYASHRWEVDVFHGQNEGLVLAELELTSENEPFDMPPWIGEEVTRDFRYANAYLAAHPYRSW